LYEDTLGREEYHQWRSRFDVAYVAKGIFNGIHGDIYRLIEGERRLARFYRLYLAIAAWAESTFSLIAGSICRQRLLLVRKKRFSYI